MSGPGVTGDRAKLPLAGVQVLDLSRVVSGPLCARLLADLGADVIKVEPPEGDVTRTAQPFVDGVSPYFAHMNAGKRAITIDLKSPEGAGVVERLAARADVLLENFRPGVLTRLGLDPERLRETNPALIVCSVTGWGQTGPWRDRKAYAPMVHAQAGTIEMASRLRGRQAEQETQIHGDVYAAVFAACAVLAALHERGRTGLGQAVDVAMAHALLYANEWAGVELQRPTTQELRARPGEYTELDRGGFDIWLHPVFLLGDGSQVALLGRAVTQLPAILETLDADRSSLEDPRLGAGNAAERDTFARGVIGAEMVRLSDFPALSAAFAGSRVMFAEVRSFADLAATEWAAERQLIAEAAPGLPLPSGPWRSDRRNPGLGGPPPRQGEHSRAILAELGCSDPEIEQLRACGAVRW
ncbi:MAG TPA: CaiB/BaiF CoA-transferase family protein [Frankiaceae bacterium]|nr:CaiB/BaiF CoA-transferase family protein [Frankiaceae bacterium]